MRIAKLSLFITIFAIFLYSCGNSDNSNDQSSDDNSVVVGDDYVDDANDYASDNYTQPSDDQQGCGFAIETVDDFIYYAIPEGMPKTFESDAGIYLFFREDGTMAGGGPGGEETMWEGNWYFESASPTGMIVFSVTMPASDNSYQMEGAYYVEFFPDDGALIFNCEDFYITNY